MSSTNKKPRRPIPKKEGNPEFREDDGYNSLIKEGEEFEQDGNIESAINKFKEASSLRPEEEYPKDKIESLKEKSNEGSNNGLFDDLGPDNEIDIEDSPIVPEDPPIVDEDPPIILEDPPIVDEDPPIILEDPPKGKGQVPTGSDVTFEYHNDRSYFFLFGPETSGKTVLISSIITYLNNYRSIEESANTISLNDESVPHEKIGLKLYDEIIKMQYNEQFPKGTLNHKARLERSEGDIPGHINLSYKEGDSDDTFDFCFMDIAGEDLVNIKVGKDNPLPESIRTYVEDVPRENMCFIFLLNPDEGMYSKSNKASLFNSFIQLLDRKGHTETPLLILVTKWDTIEDEYDNASDYISKEFPLIWGKYNENERSIHIGDFSYGVVEDGQPIRFLPKDSKRVFEWMYKTQFLGENFNNQEKTKEKKKPSFGIKSLLSKLNPKK